MYGWQGAWLQVQNAKYCFSGVFSLNETSAWILFKSCQVVALILAETVHCRQNLLFCVLLLCRFKAACVEEADDSGLCPPGETTEMRGQAILWCFIRKWLLLCLNGATLHRHRFGMTRWGALCHLSHGCSQPLALKCFTFSEERKVRRAKESDRDGVKRDWP